MRDSLPSILLLIISVTLPDPSHARTWHLEADGSGDAPTIAAAIDSSEAGDVIELACGTYVEWSLFVKSGVTIRSETGFPDCVTVDGNEPLGFGSVFGCWGADSSTLIEGLTITGGRANDHFYGVHGGGMHIASGSYLTVKQCVITGNYAKAGGGVAISSSHPVFIDCEISGNESLLYPGGIDVGLYAGFTAYGTSILSNAAGSEYHDGSVRQGSEAFFYCCTIEEDKWLFDGAYLVDNINCGPVSSDTKSWGSLKALFR